MKSLFDDNAKWTPEGNQLSNEVSHLLTPLFKKWMANGFSPRDIAHIISGEVHMTECCEIMTRDAEIHKQNKGDK